MEHESHLEKLTDITTIENKYGENLDCTVEGNPRPTKVFIFAHGFGTDKHERGLGDEMARELVDEDPNIATVRFSYSGYGESEGNQAQKNQITMAEDLESVYLNIKQEAFCPVTVVAFSMGSHVIARDNRLSLDEVVLINPPGTNMDKMKSYFKGKEDLVIDEEGTWHIPRRDGSKTLLGKDFWDSLEEKELYSNMKDLTERHKTTIIRAQDDEVITDDIREIYGDLNFENILDTPGNHDFKDPEARKEFLGKLSESCLK